ncbi:protein translocase subunit SecF [Leptospira meyeri]|uniref:protein translocase subunit SecF n=1 Tax=Leptospira meyeri TaxID=29508 RepID=UPI000C2ACC67|nr:protein translocase subunit SecF [Leptospira meyeri]PKA26101.1 protein translocase subunit SecF [Leptospira sp. mixed culture ATI2-C-A1]MCW7489769.1 protein translocase subunit SecF [Leptospira meyeri]PJZ82771.1 protein translocase subunit SecF [Leptospira meyeri]PJZ97990.1 protein translocase subunit SecF [Leptospira meyeri]PKA11392.1 protein translocase subunit SecF [Leptospira meyeri]
MRNINFTKYKYFTLSFSFLAIVFGFAVTFGKYGGFAHSLDFNGGLRTVVELPADKTRSDLDGYFQSKNIEAVVILLEKEKNIYQLDIGLGSLETIETLYKEIPESNRESSTSAIDRFVQLLRYEYKLPKEKVLSADQVGAVVGGELTEVGITLLLTTLAIILLYLSIRSQFKFALASSIALVHDILMTLALIGFLQIKPSVPIIAALLTLLGYSINDKIVVFDRIRENAHGKDNLALSNIINVSITQTLGRTINTSFTTMISVVAIIVGGAVELYDFAFVLLFGVIVGTYSSIYIAAPISEIYDQLRKKRFA